MLNDDFYNHKAAVLIVQSTMQNILAEKGVSAEGLQINEMLPLLRAIEPGTGGGGEYYLCTYVNRTYETGEFTVSGLPDDAFKDLTDWEGNPYPDKYRTKNPNGTYAPYYKEGELSGWKFKNEHGTVVYWNGEWMAWVFAPFAQGEDDNYWLSWFPARGRCEWENMKYPWDPTIEWVDGNTDSPISGLVIAPVIPPPVEQYWEGYKLVQNESGQWDYTDEIVKLTYSDFMPVAGRIYDKQCSMEIGHLNWVESATCSCPTNMTGYVKDEWIVSANSHTGGNAIDARQPWKAFDGYCLSSPDSNNDWKSWGSNEANSWLQWQNTARKVLVRQVVVFYNFHDNDCWRKPVLYGSNDGVTWEELGRIEKTPAIIDNKRVYNFDNMKQFYYHRIAETDGSGTVIPEMIAYPREQVDRNVPK